jgi:hypothetical protein
MASRFILLPAPLIENYSLDNQLLLQMLPGQELVNPLPLPTQQHSCTQSNQKTLFFNKIRYVAACELFTKRKGKL